MTRVSLTVEMTQDTIDRWARLGGDFNPLHVDPEFAQHSRFAGTIAHGAIAIALMERVMIEQLGERWLHGGALVDVRFVAPVRPGRRYELTAERSDDADPWILELRDAADGTLCVTGAAETG
jgi:3-hydroxybutyryl-CoA dehydratase